MSAQRGFVSWIDATLLAACLLCPMNAHAAGADRKFTKQLEHLEQRLEHLERENRSLRAEVKGLRRHLDAIAPALSSLEQRLPQSEERAAALKHQVEASTGEVSKAQALLSDLKETDAAPGTEWGGRLGWQGMPYHQRNNGGFFYGVFFDHRLVSHTDGLPYGDLDGEMMIAYGRSQVEKDLTVSSAIVGSRTIELRQNVVSILAGGKYFLNSWKNLGFRPYLIGGPGIWVDVIETPNLFIGQAPLAPQLAARKLPVAGGANAYGGGYAGSGFEYSLAKTEIAVVDRFALGFDYRYNMLHTGQRFSMFSFSVAAGF